VEESCAEKVIALIDPPSEGSSSRKLSMRFPFAGYQSRQADRRWFLMRRVGPGCLFWIAVSVVLSVVLTILLNLPFLLCG
jgi:hypothetical protein